MREVMEQPFVILSLGAGNFLLEKDILKDQEKYVKFLPVEGMYKGKQEHSYLITFDTDEDMQRLVATAKKFNQESIFVCLADRTSYLQDVETGERTVVGQFRQVSERETRDKENFTFDPSTKKYYIAE